MTVQPGDPWPEPITLKVARLAWKETCQPPHWDEVGEDTREYVRQIVVSANALPAPQNQGEFDQVMKECVPEVPSQLDQREVAKLTNFHGAFVQAAIRLHHEELNP